MRFAQKRREKRDKTQNRPDEAAKPETRCPRKQSKVDSTRNNRNKYFVFFY